jgi:hypothetical protein
LRREIVIEHNRNQDILNSTTEPTFLGINALLGGNNDSLRAIVEQATVLSIKMCVADAAHDNKVIENMQQLQSRGSNLLNELTEHIHNITDRASVEICKRTCKKAIEEMEKDILNVETEVMSRSDVSSKSTVKSSSLILLPPFHATHS